MTHSVEDFDLIQIGAVDINGVPLGKVIPIDIARHAVKKGLEMFRWGHVAGPAMALPKNEEILYGEFSNTIYFPILDTLVEVPWASRPGRRVGQVLCNSVLEDGRLDPTMPRVQLERQLKRLSMLGFKMTSSLTCQFTVFKEETGTKELSLLGGDNSNGLTTPYSTVGLENLMMDVCDQLHDAGVKVESWTSGRGAGTFEISTSPMEGIATADMAMRLRYGVNCILSAKGYKATFMSHPHAARDDTFSAFTFRFTLYSAHGQNLFLDERKPDNLSDLGRSWLAGLTSHGRALTALCCPLVNCYKRFSHDVTAPKRFDWDVSGETACWNVLQTGSDAWIESRLPSSACNPYFVLMTAVIAGMDGYDKNLTCPEKASPEALAVPSSLEEALTALGEDKVLEHELTPSFVSIYINVKQTGEVDKFKALEKEDNKEEKITDLENHLYFIRL